MVKEMFSYKLIKNTIDDKFKVVKCGEEKGTAYGDSGSIAEAVEEANTVFGINTAEIYVKDVVDDIRTQLEENYQESEKCNFSSARLYEQKELLENLLKENW